MRHVLVVLLLSATPAIAEAPLTAAEFEAYTVGRTLTFGSGMEPYGIERYHSGRRVTWAFIGEDCMEGVWFPQGDSICFDYEDDTPLQCWQFFDAGGGLRAEFMNEPGTSVYYEVRDADIPLICPNLGS
jgi:hypothetical protein